MHGNMDNRGPPHKSGNVYNLLKTIAFNIFTDNYSEHSSV